MGRTRHMTLKIFHHFIFARYGGVFILAHIFCVVAEFMSENLLFGRIVRLPIISKVAARGVI